MRRPAQPAAPDSSGRIHDELQISDAGRLVEKTSEIPEVRQDRINAIRAQLAAGTYETEEKLRIALDRLLDEIG
jgi:negative regulator of flagellin synthesis FlgM